MVEKALGVGPLSRCPFGSLQLLYSSHVRERGQGFVEECPWLAGGVWNGFLLEKAGRHPTPCRFCGAPDGDGHLFLGVLFPPVVEIRGKILNFMIS